MCNAREVWSGMCVGEVYMNLSAVYMDGYVWGVHVCVWRWRSVNVCCVCKHVLVCACVVWGRR